MNKSFLCIGALTFAVTLACQAQQTGFVPVTQQMLENPAPADWLMFSRTYDAQRYSPLDQITTDNVGSLTLAWARNLADGNTETVPLVYDGVMYVVTPGAVVQAMNATNGDILWTYKRDISASIAATSRAKTLAIQDDVIVWTAPDSFVVGLDARTGQLRWETQADGRGHTSGPIIVNGAAISGGACFGNRDNCYLAAHDVKTGKELWRFYTTPAPGEPGDESWNGAELNNRQASTWGFPGSYDAERGMLYWGIANPMPDQRRIRHGDPDGTSRTSPSDLYSNSTVALDAATGKLQWYFQHLPGDDWDLDATHERTLIRSKVAPDPKFVKWINPAIKADTPYDLAVTLTEGGGLFVLDRANGEFLWGMPFPLDVPEFAISSIEPTTGAVTLNWDQVFKQSGETKIVCFWNTRSYWPTAYSPDTNSLYTSYIDACRELTTATPDKPESWRAVARPGSDPNALTGIAKIDLTTGEVLRFNVGRAPSNGAVLTTAGNLVFHGDMNRRFRAFDARTGARLWETILPANISVSTISYAVNGRQYIAVMTGENLKVPELIGVVPEVSTPRGHNAIQVFALPK
ncbi:MAG: PQQ-binding-like beta-propeller repeat protein [Pseudomonadota bacterium]